MILFEIWYLGFGIYNIVFKNFKELEKKIGLNFENQELLTNAFVHRSYLNEHPEFDFQSNERLEFLGDACLELVVSEYLYQNYPGHPEGDLTNYRSAVVNTVSLAETAKWLKLGNYLLLSKGEEESGGRESEYLLANTFEALLGAIYLGKGYAAVQEVVGKFLLPKLPAILKSEAYKDAKSKLQEIAQEAMAITPHYQILSEWGPDHNKHFLVGVFVGKKKLDEGEGASKQKAELNAAENALVSWRYKE